MATPPIRNPDDRAPSPPEPLFRPSPPDRSAPIQTCRARHSPASRSATAAPGISPASVPAQSSGANARPEETFPEPVDPPAQYPKPLPKAPPTGTALSLRKTVAGYTP